LEYVTWWTNVEEGYAEWFGKIDDVPKENVINYYNAWNKLEPGLDGISRHGICLNGPLWVRFGKE